MAQSDIEQFVATIPENNIYTGREVKRMLRDILEGEGDVVLSTSEASSMLGHSAEWWRRAAPEIPGSYQPENGGPWSLPLAGYREHLAALRHRGKLRHRTDGDTKGKPFGRGPRKRPAPRGT